MSQVESERLFAAIALVAARKYPAVVDAIAVARKQLLDFTQQSQLPTSEFCRACEISPVISHVLATLREDVTFPPTPPPPPSPDPDRDVAEMPRVVAVAASAAAAAVAAGSPPDGLQPATSQTMLPALSMEMSLVKPPKRALKKAKPPPVLSRLDTAHPAFRADEGLALDRFDLDVPEHTRPEWYIRNGAVWCHTAVGGDVIVT